MDPEDPLKNGFELKWRQQQVPSTKILGGL
jgi:hypothetical protein